MNGFLENTYHFPVKYFLEIYLLPFMVILDHFPTHISLGDIFPRNLSFGNNNKMSRNEALQSCFQRTYYWVPAVIVDAHWLYSQPLLTSACFSAVFVYVKWPFPFPVSLF
jgi:hypothetical protein